jgi:hypothetical protein
LEYRDTTGVVRGFLVLTIKLFQDVIRHVRIKADHPTPT